MKKIISLSATTLAALALTSAAFAFENDSTDQTTSVDNDLSLYQLIADNSDEEVVEIIAMGTESDDAASAQADTDAQLIHLTANMSHDDSDDADDSSHDADDADNADMAELIAMDAEEEDNSNSVDFLIA